MTEGNIHIGVVGPCAAGKSTLIAALRKRGYSVRHIAQEHSYIKDMWLRLTNPDILIYLDVSYTTSCRRRNMDWTEKEYQTEIKRLAHAREHAHFYLDTDSMEIQEVYDAVIHFLNSYTT